MVTTPSANARYERRAASRQKEVAPTGVWDKTFSRVAPQIAESFSMLARKSATQDYNQSGHQHRRRNVREFPEDREEQPP